jgi:hypothetical protein
MRGYVITLARERFPNRRGSGVCDENRCVVLGIKAPKPAPSGTAGNTVDQYRLKPLQTEVVRPIRELESESQNGESKRKSPLTCFFGVLSALFLIGGSSLIRLVHHRWTMEPPPPHLNSTLVGTSPISTTNVHETEKLNRIT